jgi:signal transduction histidine kinase
MVKPRALPFADAIPEGSPRGVPPWYTGLTWRGLAVVALLCFLNALRRASEPVFTKSASASAVGIVEDFGNGLVVALPMTMAVVWVCNRVPRTSRLRFPLLGAALAFSSAVGVAIVVGYYSTSEPVFDAANALSWFVGTWPRYALLGALFAGIFVYVRDREQIAAAADDVEHDRAQLARQMDEARLAVLQAQIEPHFLFNTLATVRRLYQGETTAGARMLDSLMRYLGVALPHLRATVSTLRREVVLVEAYLDIQQMRLGRRVAFAVDIPETLGGAAFPPVMLLTLVENAIKHGISPLREGGFVRISAEVEDGDLQVQVADSGRGFAASSGAGTGLANTRARLSALYGRRGRLHIRLNLPRGVTATIRLPYTEGPHPAGPGEKPWPRAKA